jgi:hypothetical protein
VVLFHRGAWCPYCNPQLRATHEPAFPVSSGAIGRLVPEDVIVLVHCLRVHAPAATS